jgi:hypothetical protein
VIKDAGFSSTHRTAAVQIFRKKIIKTVFMKRRVFLKKIDQTKGAGAVIKEETASGVYAIYSTTTPRMLGSKALHWC